MKKIISSLVFFLLLSNFMVAQISIKTPAQHQPNTTLQYDSLENYTLDIYKYIGQELFVKPTYERNDYEDFFLSISENKVYNGRKGKSSYKKLESNIFRVNDVVARLRKKGKEIPQNISGLSSDSIYYLKLQLNNEIVYYKFPSSSVRFPFFVVGYIEKLKQTFVGTEWILAKIGWNNPTYDYVTGKLLQITPGDKWKVSEIGITIEPYLSSLDCILVNANGETIEINPIRLLKISIERNEYERFINLYGFKMTYDAINGVMKIDMPIDLVLIAWGQPREIKKSSDNTSQWIYKNSNVYFKNGKVARWD